jgi:ketol-acid reductoisomerase
LNNEDAAKFIIKTAIPRIIEERKNESYTEYNTEIPSPEELKMLEELRKYPKLHRALKEMPEHLINKIDKVLRAFYSK